MSLFGEIQEFFNDPIGYTSEAVDTIGSNVTRIIGEGVAWLTGLDDLPDPNAERNVLLNKESNVAPIPVVYGRRKIGGTRVAVGLSSDKKDLYIVLAMCEGEIQEIESIYINDIISTDSRFSGKVTINQYLGTDSQTADSMLTTAFPTLWTSNHRLRGIAYLACKFTYDPEVFRSVPEITAIVKGRKVYDPRDTTTAYSDNPALCLLDYLTNSRYGKGLALSDIDTTAFGSAATDCEDLVTKYTGAPADTEIFTCNAVLPTDKTIFDNVKVLLSGMRGLLPYQNGKYGLRIEQDEASVMSFDTDNMVGGVSIQFLGKQRRYNKVTARFVNPDANWQADTVVWPPAGSTEESTFATEDDGFELSTEINLPTCTDFYAARDLARLVCLASRNNNYAVSFSATSDALKVEAGDIIDITYDTPNWSSQKFRVNEIQVNADGTIGISAQKHDATIYPWDTSTEFTDLGDFGEITQYSTVDAPTNLSASSSIVTQESGEQFIKVVLSWTASSQYNLLNYEVQWKKSSDTSYQSAFTTDTSLEGGGIEANTSYNVRVKAITTDGGESSYLTGTFSSATGMTTSLREGDAASDVNSNSTTVNGTKITANTISADRIQSNTTKTANNTEFGLGTGTTFEGIQSGGQFIADSSSKFGLVVANENTSGHALAVGTRSTTADKWAILAGSGANSSFTTFSHAVGICDGAMAGNFIDVGSSEIELAVGGYAYYIQSGSGGPFTGAHDGLFLKTSVKPSAGDILVDQSVVGRNGVSDTITEVATSTSTNQKNVIGVYAGQSASNHSPTALTENVASQGERPDRQLKSEHSNVFDTYDAVIVNSLGEGQINVCNEGGNIEAGDLIVTSSMTGKGMKQSDDIIRNYTVAKAREAVTFSSASDVQQIACIYLCG